MRLAREVSVRIPETVVAVSVAVALAGGPILAQVATPKPAPAQRVSFDQIGLFVYPAKGQSAEQQQKDKDACYDWAEVNTGLTLTPGSVDARAAGQTATQGVGQGKVVGGAATGAATGLAIGAISGNAGKGAAIGAVAGSVGGLRGRRNARRAAGQEGAQQAVQANQQAVEQFKRAAGACLEARGYSVR